jgi:hypothetical protein
MNEQDREIRGTIVPQGDRTDTGTDAVAAARKDVAETRERVSDTVAEIESRVSEKVASVKQKVDIVGIVKANPWPSLAAAVVAGIALSATGADRKAASATLQAAKRAPDTAKSGARAAAAGVSSLAGRGGKARGLVPRGRERGRARAHVWLRDDGSDRPAQGDGRCAGTGARRRAQKGSGGASRDGDARADLNDARRRHRGGSGSLSISSGTNGSLGGAPLLNFLNCRLAMK